MNTSLKPGSSREDDIDAALLSVDNYVRTLESAVLHLKTDHEARKCASEVLESPFTSQDISLEEYAANVNDSVKEARMLLALQLADEQKRLLLSGDRELKALCAENSRICNEIMKKQEKLEEANETIWRLKNSYCRLIAKKIPLEESLDQQSKLSPEEKAKLEAEQNRLKVLNNVLLQLIVSSGVNWSQDSHLSALVEEASQLI